MQSIRTKDSHRVPYDKSAKVSKVLVWWVKNTWFLERRGLRSIFEVSYQAILKIIFRINPESTFCGSFCCLFRMSWPSTRASYYQWPHEQGLLLHVCAAPLETTVFGWDRTVVENIPISPSYTSPSAHGFSRLLFNIQRENYVERTNGFSASLCACF